MADEPAPGGPMTLDSHEAASQTRFEKLAKKLKKLKESNMADTPDVNIYQKDPMAGLVPMLMGNTGSGAGAIGGGLGAGLLGGILGGALLGHRGGLFGGGVVGDGVVAPVVSPTLLATEINRVQDNTNAAIAASERLNMARFDAEAQRDIEAAIERTAAANLLAIATGNAALGVEMAKGAGETNTQVALTTGNLGTQNALNAAAIQTQAAKQAGDLSTQIALNTASVATAVERTGTATALAFKDSALLAQGNTTLLSSQLSETKYALATAVKADGDLTRALIIAQNDANLQRQLTTAENQIIELRGDRNMDRRSRETEINVTQNVNQQQVQLQQQQQQQTQLNLLSQICAGLGNLTQIAHATNNSIIAGNTGAVVGGAQTANPTNIRT